MTSTATRPAMRAVVAHGAGDLRLEERPTPAPGPGEAAVDIRYGGARAREAFELAADPARSCKVLLDFAAPGAA